MRITETSLHAREERYGEILELTPRAHELLTQPVLAAEIAREFAATRFVKVEDILPADAVNDFAANVSPIMLAIAEEVTMLHKPGPNHSLSDGARFWRVDPYCVRWPAAREKMTLLLKELGLTEFGSLLVRKLTPLICHIAGSLSFERTYFYLYKEGDYISVHDDHHVGQRVDVQFPVALGTSAGVRVLSDGFLRLHYDTPGSMNLLGPCIWHDVPPIVAGLSGTPPLRFNMGFRFVPS